MLAANTDWMFTPPGWRDPWTYFALFRHYDVASFMADEKKLARLPWVLLGFAANKLLPPVPAAFWLHVSCFAAGLVLLYLVAARMFGREAGAIAALSYLTWIPTHGAAGWDYHDTLLPACYFAAYLALISRRFLLFGILYALAVHTNILAVLLAPALCIRATHLRLWSRAALGYAVAGGVGITVVLGAINVAFGRMFLFPEILVSRSIFLIQNPRFERGFMEPWSNLWWLREPHTALLAAVLILIVVYAVATFRSWSTRALFASSAACACLEFVVVLALFTAGQLSGQPMLTPFYMLMPAALPMFIAIAALASVAVGGNNRFATAAVVGAVLAFMIQFLGRLAPSAPQENFLPIGVVLAGFLVAAIIARFPLPAPHIRHAIAFVCIAVALGQTNALWPGIPQSYWIDDSCRRNRALLLAHAQADAVLFPLARSGMEILPWFKLDERAGPSSSCSLSGADLAAGSLVTMGYGLRNVGVQDMFQPEMPDRVIERLDPKSVVIALITNDNAYVSHLLKNLQQRNKSWRETNSYGLGENPITFALHVISAQPSR